MLWPGNCSLPATEIPLAASPVFIPTDAPEIGIATRLLTSGSGAGAAYGVVFSKSATSSNCSSNFGNLKFEHPLKLNLRADLERDSWREG